MHIIVRTFLPISVIEFFSLSKRNLNAGESNGASSAVFDRNRQLNANKPALLRFPAYFLIISNIHSYFSNLGMVLQSSMSTVIPL